MRLSRYFLPLIKEDPKEAEIVSHRLMLRAGMIRQESAGIYAWLPLGLRVLKKVEQVIREEQNRAGAIELLMPTIQPADLWVESGRYDDYGKEMLRVRDRHDRPMLFGPTNEEMITEIFRSAVRSYKDLPLSLYHIQWKFRDEVRPRFGVMRSREFLMKDAYSFDLDRESARRAYNRMFVSYLRTFDRFGLTAIPMKAESGPIGGDMSHEFIILASTGESQVFCHRDALGIPVPDASVDYSSDPAPVIEAFTANYAATEDMHEPARFSAEVDEADRVEARGIEVGHIFYFGTKYSRPMGAIVTGPDGKDHPVHMGSYGIGPTRLAAAIIEANHDENGITWPRAAAPFDVGLINLKAGDAETETACADLYGKLVAAGIEVLYDDRDERAGAKFPPLDLIGLPHQLIVGPRGLANGEVELKDRLSGERHALSPESAMARLMDSARA